MKVLLVVLAVIAIVTGVWLFLGSTPVVFAAAILAFGTLVWKLVQWNKVFSSAPPLQTDEKTWFGPGVWQALIILAAIVVGFWCFLKPLPASGATLMLVALVGISGMFVKTPPVHADLVTRIGKRTGRMLKEGLNVIFPFLDDVMRVSLELDTKPVKMTTFTIDKLELVLEGSVQWWPDKSRDGNGERLLMRFVQVAESTILAGITDAVKEVLAIVAGTKNGEEFIDKREAVRLLINCVLRMKTPPHLVDKKEPTEWLDYYVTNAPRVRELLNSEAEDVTKRHDRSVIEERYGIDIRVFALADVDFSPATKKAFELKKQEEARMAGVKAVQATKLELIKQFRSEEVGLSPDAAVRAAETVLGQADRKIFEIPGLSPETLARILKGVANVTR